MTKECQKVVNNRGLRLLLTAIGLCCVGLAVLGIFLPVLPTVPLLLLAAACFARSSDRFYNWLLGHPRLGPMIKGYLDGQGIPLKAKVSAISLIWLTLSISVFLLVPYFWVQILLIAIGLCITLYLWRLPVCEPVKD